MARIVYGVQGEGRGHSSRSRIVIEHLLASGHAVRVFTSRKAYAYLQPLLPDVHDILGLAFVFDGERVDVGKTLRRNIQDATSEIGRTFRLLHEAFKEFRPDLAISDFEPFVSALVLAECGEGDTGQAERRLKAAARGLSASLLHARRQDVRRGIGAAGPGPRRRRLRPSQEEPPEDVEGVGDVHLARVVGIGRIEAVRTRAIQEEAGQRGDDI